MVDDVLIAETVREAVLAVAGVVGISSGRGYIEATYGRGTHVRGVGIMTESGHVVANVHVIVAETRIPALARLVRQVVRTTIERASDLPPGPINLFIDDMLLDTTTSDERPA